jgi:hypothetical protein
VCAVLSGHPDRAGAFFKRGRPASAYRKVLSSGRFCQGSVILRAQFSCQTWHTDPFFLVRVPSVTLECTNTSAGVSCLQKECMV